MAENIDMNKITTEIDEVYNDSSKHVTFDEQGNSFNNGRNITDQNAVEYSFPTDSLNKPDPGYVNVSETSRNSLNPIEDAPSHTVNNEQTRIPHLNGEF